MQREPLERYARQAAPMGDKIAAATARRLLSDEEVDDLGRNARLTTAPTGQQRLYAALHMVCHGPYASALHRARVIWPRTGPASHERVMYETETILKAALDTAFGVLRPQDLDQLSQAVEAALEKMRPRFRALDGANHLRPE